MSLKITTLIENLQDKEKRLCFEHGFSVLIETEDTKILFDTGQTGAFVKNAKDLEINLEDIDTIILSHGHYDHTGGIPALQNVLHKKVPVYIGKEFFAPKYKLLEDGSYKYNGNPFVRELLIGISPESESFEVRYIEENVTKLSKQLFLFKNFSRENEFETVNPKFFVKTGQKYEQDLFPDEIALGIITEKGLVLVVGCAHVGIVNMLEHVKRILDIPVFAVLGGTHLVEAGEERLVKTAEALRRHGVKLVAVSHCTGEKGMELLKKEFSEGFVLNNTGNIIEFEN